MRALACVVLLAGRRGARRNAKQAERKSSRRKAGVARGAMRSKQKEGAADATRSKNKERTAGQEKGGNPPEEEKESRRACREIRGGGCAYFSTVRRPTLGAGRGSMCRLKWTLLIWWTAAATAASGRELLTADCPATCFGYSCDAYVENPDRDETCEELECAYACDCSGCACANAPTVSPTTTKHPTPMPTPAPAIRLTTTLSPTSLYAPTATPACPSDGTVSSAQKISNSEGELPFALGQDDRFGCSVSSIGDLDADGVNDLAVGAWGDDDGNTKAGAVHVLFMQASGVVRDSQKLSNSGGDFPYTLAENEYFGSALAWLGDMNGDGVNDLAVGAYGCDNDRGAVYLLCMRSDGTVDSSVKIANGAGGIPFGALAVNDYFGASIAWMGDLNGDGFGDLAVGASGSEDYAGQVYILFMTSDMAVLSFEKISNSDSSLPFMLTPGDRFGASVASSLGFDSTWDLAVGARADSDGGVEGSGAVYLLSLNSNGTIAVVSKLSNSHGSLPFSLDVDDFFGQSVAFVGDINGDGLLDLAVGAFGDNDGGYSGRPGAVYWLFMDGDGQVSGAQKLSNDEGNLPFAIQDDDWFGSSVAAFEIDGGSGTGLVVGAYTDDDGAYNAGAVYLLATACAPTPVPTMIALQRTEISLVPHSLNLVTTKPQVVSGVAYLVNLNDGVLHGNVSLKRTSLPDGASWQITPSEFNLDSNEVVEFQVTVESTGLSSGEYDLALEITAETAESVPAN